jgi:hypothetical protein
MYVSLTQLALNFLRRAFAGDPVFRLPQLFIAAAGNLAAPS